MSTLKKIRLIAVDTNGVLLNDIFAESLRHFVERHGGVYTAELERIVLGAPHIAGGHALSAACGLALTAQECIHLFLEEHKVLTRDRPVTLHPAAPAVLEALAGLGARVTTYGGRPAPAMLDGFLAPCLPWLDADAPYVDMDGFRPGMKEIARDVFGCAFDEVVFIDDLSKVAGASRALGAGFVGLPSTPFQRDQMAALGVRHMVSRLEDLDADVVRRVDADLAAGSAWPIAAAA